MLYESTRGHLKKVTSSYAIKDGLAADGGLYVPENCKSFSTFEIEQLIKFNYKDRAISILKEFLTDFEENEIIDCVNNSYNNQKFSDPKIAPLKKLNKYIDILELWHGPTCAFKDMALQILPHLLSKSIEKTGEKSEIVILVATSGDTGKAALDGFKDVKGTKVIVFFPQDGVSQIQRLQMVTQEGNNVHSVAVNGNFDDAQNQVKSIFSNNLFNENLLKRGYLLSSANSINWGRLAPQIVYYFSAYADKLSSGDIKNGEKINFVVPTGNFGNILAAYYAKEMGLPINKLICASNENNILTDFIKTGKYNKNRVFHKTTSPSMDILVSSNLERLLYHLTDRDSTKINTWMLQLKEVGEYQIDDTTFNKISNLFYGNYATSDEASKTTKSIYQDYNYVVDPHTAVAINVYEKYVASTTDMTKTVIVSTASPFKFNRSVASAILGETETSQKTEIELLNDIGSRFNLPIPESLKNIDQKKILHELTCEKTDMEKMVLYLLK